MKTQLLDILQTIEKPGSFCSSNEVPPCFLGLEVKNIGEISFPLTKMQASALIDQCHQAPYGRGEDTVVDTNVRQVWELNSEQFEITNPQWQQNLHDICSNVKVELGVAAEISCEIYKLLIYEKGSFFLPHRDTEKMAGMFATLVIILPSKHEGGELIIRHDGEEKCFAFGGEESHHKIRYAAFYADCEHEVKPVTDGYRLCLVYNLALAKKDYPQPLAPQNSNIVNQLAASLNNWVPKEDAEKLVILLEHQYTEAELSFESLKNADRMQAGLLVKAAQSAGCKAHLALVTLWESGDPEGYDDYDNYYGRRNNRRSQPERPNHYDMGEVFDHSLSIDNWIDIDGTKKSFGEMNIAEEDIVAKEDIHDRKPDAEEFEGFTGNAGATVDHWYHRAAIVIWKNKQHFSVLTHKHQFSALPELQLMLAEKSVDLAACKEFALVIINNWQLPSDASQQMLSVLLSLDDTDLLVRFFNDILIHDFFGNEGQEIYTICQKYGWLAFEYALSMMSKQTTVNKIAAFALILEVLSQEANQNDEQISLCTMLAENILESFLAMPMSVASGWRYNPRQDVETNNILIQSLFKSLFVLNQSELVTKLGQHLNSEPKKFDLYSIRIPLMKALSQWLALQKTSSDEFKNVFFQPCFVEIQELATMLIEAPKDWQRDSKLSCKCQDCQDLAHFLQRPLEKEYRFQAIQERRTHVENTIKQSKSDLNCETLRKGSPHTLICTKNQASYERAKQQQTADIKLWRDLEKLSKWH